MVSAFLLLNFSCSYPAMHLTRSLYMFSAVFLRPCHRQRLRIRLSEQTSEGVVACLDMIEESIGTELFKEMFPYILTDNGHEFADIDGMQRSVNGGQRTFIYFCEPNHPEQKGGCEKNHEFIRYVIKKGASLEPYSQSDISMMMDHINSYARKELHGRSPYAFARSMYPEDFFTLYGERDNNRGG